MTHLVNGPLGGPDIDSVGLLYEIEDLSVDTTLYLDPGLDIKRARVASTSGVSVAQGEVARVRSPRGGCMAFTLDFAGDITIDGDESVCLRVSGQALDTKRDLGDDVDRGSDGTLGAGIGVEFERWG